MKNKWDMGSKITVNKLQTLVFDIQTHWRTAIIYRSLEQKRIDVRSDGLIRIVHGKEIVYEGWAIPGAVEAFNLITRAPNKENEPKLDN